MWFRPPPKHSPRGWLTLIWILVGLSIAVLIAACLPILAKMAPAPPHPGRKIEAPAPSASRLRPNVNIHIDERS